MSQTQSLPNLSSAISQKTLSKQENKFKTYLNSVWDKYDVDKNGKLDRDEAKDLYKHMVTDLQSRKFYDEMKFMNWFTKADSDGNGTLSKDEIADALLGLFF